MAAMVEDAVSSSLGDTDKSMALVEKNVLLLIVGEPFTDSHKQLIKEKITTGKYFYLYALQKE